MAPMVVAAIRAYLYLPGKPRNKAGHNNVLILANAVAPIPAKLMLELLCITSGVACVLAFCKLWTGVACHSHEPWLSEDEDKNSSKNHENYKQKA
jgi:hypothetical protein